MTVIFFKFLERERVTETGESKTSRIPMIRKFSVFNAEQIDGLKLPALPEVDPTPIDPIEACQSIVDGFQDGPEVVHAPGGNRALYNPRTDQVTLPELNQFDSPEAYYAVCYHELGHSTGHESRLDRDLGIPMPFGSQEYSKEELVAEMTSSMLCGVAGISPATIDNSASYIQGWLRALKNDHKLVVRAASAAQRAADLILGPTPEKAAE